MKMNRVLKASGEFADFKANDPNENIYPKPTSDREFVEIINSVLLGRDWVVADPLPHSQVLTTQLFEILAKYSSSSISDVLPISKKLPESVKNLYDGILSYHLNLYWRIKFVSEKDLTKTIDIYLNEGLNEFVRVDDEDGKPLIFYGKRNCYILDSIKVRGYHIRDFIEKVKEKQKKEESENE